jgi:hypothetical protein
MSNLFKSSAELVVSRWGKPDAATVAMVLEEVLPALSHLESMTERLESTKAAAKILQTCINQVGQVIHGSSNESEATQRFSMNR